MLDSTSVKTIEYNGINPFEFLEIINNKSKKKFRVYDVDYYDEDNNRPKRNIPKEISNMIESIIKKDDDDIWDDD